LPDKNILLIAGDPSGDLHGAGLIRELKALRPDVRVACLGGARMQAEADEFIFDLASRGLSGFIDPILKIFLIRRLLSVVRHYLDTRRPAAFVPIDFYGFNHQVLGQAKHRGVPAFYYVSPQVWASRAGRIHKLKRLVERMLLIFPFEVPLYHKAGVPCSFVGHPLLDIIPEPEEKNSTNSAPRIGLLPGSRVSELDRHLPVMLDALRRIRRRLPKVEAQLFASKNISDEFLKKRLKDAAVQIVRESDYRERSRLDFAMTSSGTATLENSLLGVPMVVMYKMNWPTYWIAKSIVKIPHISMANILAGKELVPELIQSEATGERAAAESLSFLEDPAKLADVRSQLLSLREKLGGPGAAKRAAAIILETVGAAAQPAPPPRVS
jgi:lipid-A-disaccharide synthase